MKDSLPIRELIPLKELAKRLHRTPRTVLRWRWKYGFPFYRVGRASSYIWEEVLQILTANRVGLCPPTRGSQELPCAQCAQCRYNPLNLK